MAVYNTYEENGRTIRVWRESRGRKTLERKFYIAFEINAKLNGKWGRKVLNTLDEAIEYARHWGKAIQEKYGFTEWIGYDRQILTHINGLSYRAIGGGKNSAEFFITEVNPGEPTISERLIAA